MGPVNAALLRFDMASRPSCKCYLRRAQPERREVVPQDFSWMHRPHAGRVREGWVIVSSEPPAPNSPVKRGDSLPEQG